MCRCWSITSWRSWSSAGCRPRRVARETLSRLLRYDWPGNVRELEHLIEQMVVTTPGPVIEPENLPPQIVPLREEPFSLDFDHDRPLQELTDEFTERIERAYLIRVLEKYRGRIDRCADHCGLSRRSISEKLRRYQIDKTEFKPVHPRPQAIRDGGRVSTTPCQAAILGHDMQAKRSLCADHDLPGTRSLTAGRIPGEKALATMPVLAGDRRLLLISRFRWPSLGPEPAGPARATWTRN